MSTMSRSSRIPLAIIGGAVLIAAVIALRPDGGSNAGVTPGVAQAATASTDPGALVPFLRFSGTGTVTVKPDTAVIQVGVSTTGKTSQAALDKASTQLKAVESRLRSLGVADADIATSGNWTYQDYQTKDFHAELSLTVKVRKLEDAGKLLAAASAAGAANVSGPMYSVEDTHAAYATALRAAIEDARGKAEAAAAQMGVRVTGVVSVDDQSGGGPIFPYAAKDAAASVAGGTAEPVPVPVNPGTQDVGATVTVVFSYLK
jgi:uncharacterized protein YggE